MEVDKLIALTRVFFWLAVIQHFPRTGQLDKKPPAGIKPRCDEPQGYNGPHPALKRYPEPRSLPGVRGLLSAAPPERGGKTLAFNLAYFFDFNSCIGLHIEFSLQGSSVNNSLYTEKNLLFSVTNLFGAGTDTTAATLRWGLLLMAKYPQIQGDEKCAFMFTCKNKGG